MKIQTYSLTTGVQVLPAVQELPKTDAGTVKTNCGCGGGDTTQKCMKDIAKMQRISWWLHVAAMALVIIFFFQLIRKG